MITSDRNVFLGAHVTKEVKLALVKASYEKNMSMSQLVHIILKKALLKK